ncbi:hypothetical protein RQP46_009460 [Phenoliferia psychrophenolica]
MTHQGKVYCISGASGGMGREMALLLAREGAKVGLADVASEAALEAIKKEVEAIAGPGSAYTRFTDVSQDEDVKAWVDGTVKAFGKLDGAINAAGLGPGVNQAVGIVSDASWDKVIAVNLTGIMYACRAQLKGSPESSAYCSSKFGVIGITKTVAREYGARGIRCNAICPGPIATPLFYAAAEGRGWSEASMSVSTCLKRMGKPEEIASVAAFLLSDASSYVTGVALPVDGGVMA